MQLKPDPEMAIEVISVSKHFGDLKALDGVSMSIPPGKVLGLLGPNGAGKTTLVRIIATLSRPTSGTVFVHGHDVEKEPGAVRKIMGMTGQFQAIDHNLTGRENLTMVGRLYHLSRSEARARAKELLQELNLTDAADRLVKTYSGGMRRRLDIAASLVARPPILILDEPTSGLDPKARMDMWATLRTLIAGGSTLLLTTQYLEEADALADRIVIIDEGRILAEGTPSELKDQIGGNVLIVRPKSAADLPRIGPLMSSLGQGEAVRANDHWLLNLSDGSAIMSELVHKLDEASIALDELSLKRPSLDEVFLTLTQSSAEERG